MPINKITHVSIERGKPTPRDIIVISGMCFYRSSGINSHASDTWFPFFGIEQDREGMLYGRGWYRKNVMGHHLPEEIAQKVQFHLGGKDILIRFSNVPALLISSLLGGGLWETKDGKALKAYLQQQYSDFYNTWPTLTVAKEGKEFTKGQIEEVNAWLIKHAQVNNLDELYTKPIADLKDLETPQTDLVVSKTSKKTAAIKIDTVKNMLNEPVNDSNRIAPNDLNQSLPASLNILPGYIAEGKHGKPISGRLEQSMMLTPLNPNEEIIFLGKDGQLFNGNLEQSIFGFSTKKRN